MMCTRSLLVLFACVATGLSLLCLSGCRKEEPVVEKPAVEKPVQAPMSTVAERMADKDYLKQLDAQRVEQKRLAAQLNAATNDAQRKAAAQLLEVNRLRTAEIVRARMAWSNKEISK